MDETLCIQMVTSPGLWCRQHQCNRKRGHGPDGKYCKQHDPVARKKRNDIKEKKWNNDFKKRMDEHLRNNILNELAEGISTRQLKQYKLVRKAKK